MKPNVVITHHVDCAEAMNLGFDYSAKPGDLICYHIKHTYHGECRACGWLDIQTGEWVSRRVSPDIIMEKVGGSIKEFKGLEENA
jgi:hypothetical protein